MQRWSALPYEQLICRLDGHQAYVVEHDSRKYQVEVELLENTEEYVHVIVGVDDGSLPASFAPSTDSFILQKSRRTV
jgi:hypothetical protein